MESPKNTPESVSKNLYHSLLSSLDTHQISPNRLVSIRAAVSMACAGVMASTDNLSLTSEISLLVIFTLSLIADRLDGDLARFTNQCSDTGEVWDAGADKLVVYTSLLCILLSMSGEIENSTLYTLGSLAAFSAILDSYSQLSRGIEKNLNALKESWKSPLTPEEREANKSREKTGNAANIFGKLKTGLVMWGVTLGLQGALPISDETKTNSVNSLIGGATLLSLISLEKKRRQSQKKT